MAAEDVQAVSTRLHHHLARMYICCRRRRICLMEVVILKLHRKISKIRRKKWKRSCLLRISEAVTISSPNIWNRSNSPSNPKS